MSDSDLVATHTSFLLGVRATNAGAALVCFEHLITFNHEIDFLCKRKWSAATWILVSNRYLLLASVLSQVAPVIPQICNNSMLFNTINFLTSGEIQTIPTHAFTVLRTFALLQGHSWRLPVTWTLIALALAVVALSSYVQLTQTWFYADDPTLGSSCFADGSSVPFGIISRVDGARSIINIISAFIVLGVVLLKTARQVQQAVMLGLKTTLSEVLLRDGSLFFGLLLLQDISITISTFDESFWNSCFSYVTIPVLNVLSQVLLSRFIINLRQADSPGTNTSARQHPSRYSIPNFRMPTMDDVVGNLGEPLDLGEHRLDGEDDARADGANANADVDQTDVDATSTSRATGFADIEAAGLSGSGGAHADVLGVDGILEELRLSPPRCEQGIIRYRAVRRQLLERDLRGRTLQPPTYRLA